MLCEVFRLLSHKEAEQIVHGLSACTFVDGKYSAQGLAREAKNNLQVDPDHAERGKLERVVQAAFQRDPQFLAFAMPKRFMPVIFSRYEPGMQYGSHIDDAMMGGFAGVRTDFSITLFLSPPDAYEGGELVLENSFGGDEIKLDIGEAIVYPSTTVHHVAPVCQGVRLAAVTWIQSAVRDAALRAVLHDLNRSMQLAQEVKRADLSLLLGKSFNNLIRYAAEP